MEGWKEALVRYFEQGAKCRKTENLGVEVEHFILDGDTGRSVPYSGERGVRNVLKDLMACYPDAEALPDDDFFGFCVPEFNITLEPAAQLEISIATTDSIAQIRHIYQSFSENLNRVLSAYGYKVFHSGCRPLDLVSDLEMIPKRRYALMNRHFRNFGTGGMEMMRGTASLQVSIDYTSEEDFRKKIQAAYYYGPVFKILCDNTARFQGNVLKGHLKRTDIWRRTDPLRCGILPGVFSPAYGFEDYADFLGNMPPIFLKTGQDIRPTGMETTASLFKGKSMSEEEVTHVLSMGFPDVRLKKYLEIRFADSVPSPYIEAYCALIKGLLYSEEGLLHAQKQIRELSLSEEMLRAAEDELMSHGFDGSLYGKPCRETVLQVLDLAKEQLSDEDKGFLEPFYTVVQRGGILPVLDH